MTHLLAAGPLQLTDIAPADFVPIAVLLVLLVEREVVRARPGRARTLPQRIIDFAVFPLMILFLLFVGLRTYTMLGGPL
jgi:hypothetical protein